MKCMGLILAAGKSRRFGNANKLLAPLLIKSEKQSQKMPLVSYAIETMRQTEFSCRVALVDDPNLEYLFEGFEILRPMSVNSGLGENLAVGAAYAKKMLASHLLITLGDMPFITGDMLDEIKNTCPEQGISIAKGSGHVSVPACFHASYFDKLIDLDGDKGAGMIAMGEKNTKFVSMNDLYLRDVDTLKDLEEIERSF